MTLPAPTNSNWDQDILNNSHVILTHGNNPKTRVLVVSNDELKDNQLKDDLKKDVSKMADKIACEVIPITDYCLPDGSFQDENRKNEFILKVKHVWKPTVILIDKTHNQINKALADSTLLHPNPFKSKDYTIYQTLNITISEPAILTFSVPATTGRVRDTLREWLKEQKIPNVPESKVLWIDGSHGGQRVNANGDIVATGGESGLTDETSLNHVFYEKACGDVGIKPDPSSFEYKKVNTFGDFIRWKTTFLPFWLRKFWAGQFDICSPPVVSSPLPQDSLLNDPELAQMTFNVLNLARYYDRPELRGNDSNAVKKRYEAFVEDIKRFGPTCIFIGFCYSANGDVALALRANSIFSLMLMEHELREITGIKHAKLHPSQREILEKICDDEIKHCILYGSNGVGKSFVGAAFVKDKGAAVLRADTDINLKVVVCQMVPGNVELLQLFRLWKQKYFKDIHMNVNYETGTSICEKFGLDFDKFKEDDGTTKYIDIILEVCRICDENNRKNKNTKTIFLFDDVFMDKPNVDNVCDFDTPLSKLAKYLNIHVAICVNPHVNLAKDKFSVALPQNHPGIYSTNMIVCYRNCLAIRRFIRFFQDHNRDVPSSENDEVGEHIPPSLDNVGVQWIQCESEQSMEKSASKMVHKFEQMKEKPDVVILYDPDKEGICGRIAAKVKGQQEAFHFVTYLGCECDVVILITNEQLSPEAVSRPRRKLVIITGPELVPNEALCLEQAADKHHHNHNNSWTGPVDMKNPLDWFKCRGEGRCGWSEGWAPLVQHWVACDKCGEMTERSRWTGRCQCGQPRRLPLGWSKWRTTARPVYFNHIDHETHLQLPDQVEASEDLSSRLPEGWQRSQTKDGTTFHVNHNDATTHQQFPGGIKFEKVGLDHPGRMATVGEVRANFDDARRLLGAWTIALLDGGKLCGTGYGSTVEEGDFSHQIPPQGNIIGEKIIVVENQSPKVATGVQTSRKTTNEDAKKRLLHDFKDLQKNPLEGAIGSPQESNILTWNVAIFGPDDTVFQDGTFEIKLEFSEAYPYRPPTVYVVTNVFHPNVYSDTGLFQNILEDNWSPAKRVSDILTDLRRLLTEPNLKPQYVANPVAAKLYQENRGEFNRRVRQCIEQSLDATPINE